MAAMAWGLAFPEMRQQLYIPSSIFIASTKVIFAHYGYLLTTNHTPVIETCRKFESFREQNWDFQKFPQKSVIPDKIFKKIYASLQKKQS